jgi:hypothetical protein
MCSHAHAIAKSRCPPKVRLCGGASADELIVNKHCAVGNEALVSDGYELTDECVRLNPASLADIYALLYLYEWTNETAISNRAPVEIDGLYHGDLFAKLNIYNPGMTDLWLCQRGLA